MMRDLLLTGLAIILGAGVAVGIRQHVEAPQQAIDVVVDAQEAALFLPSANVTVPIPDGLPRIMIGMDQTVVETTDWNPPEGTNEASREWWRENRYNSPVVFEMEHGAFREEDRKGMMSMPLYDALLEIAEQHKSLGEVSDDREDEFRGEVVIALDQRAPWSTVIEVLYTAGQAQFSVFSLEVRGGGAVEFGVTALSNEPMVSIEDDRLLLSWFRGTGTVEIPCAQGCDAALSEALDRMRWHTPWLHGGVIVAGDDIPISRVFTVHRLLARDTALLSALHSFRSNAFLPVSLTTLLSEGEPLHALMEGNRETAERISVGPIRIEGTRPMKWRRRLESVETAIFGAKVPAPALGTNDVRACLLPALLAEPTRSGEIEVAVYMTSEAIYAVHTPWSAVNDCLSRRLVGRSLRSSSWGFFGVLPTVEPGRAVAKITATIAVVP